MELEPQNPLPRLVVIDVETTGMNPNEGHSVIEVAAQELTGRLMGKTYQALVKLDRPLDPEVSAIHGITDELLALEGRDRSQVFKELMEFIADSVLVGHNIGFDLAFLNAEQTRLEQPVYSNETLDTLELAKRYLILPSYSLKTIAAYLEVPQPTSHRALADVETTRQVFIKLVERAKQAK